ncbi:MAG: hypothetical protein CFE23_16130 [Flavobacterium sp. BFFFF1]|uniref:DUF4294 domain-containing protein n=1 Tax=Flavobacterium sp. BFFFF1 TaxID=2015557 RepID=UPI000BD9AC52|nr:DUF4294 domain-containing protein [Flavobacterium sp. BFFFF1]OYU79007.1 MAG: hypothetical protein CFE23_16130 [Flavobacterium sp. BFFFF1]
MKVLRFLVIALFMTAVAAAQEEKPDKRDDYLNEPDTITLPTVGLEEVVIDMTKYKEDAESRKQFAILQRRVYKVYPYAKSTAANLTALNAGMAKLKSNRDKKKYFKIVEDYLDNQFKPQLKKLSRKDGQILVKLIFRQTGSSTFDLIKEYKSGWKAFWSNSTAKLFDINLKTKYEPMVVNEDYLIETILVRAFKSGRLSRQDAPFAIDYQKISDYWVNKLGKKSPGQD